MLVGKTITSIDGRCGVVRYVDRVCVFLLKEGCSTFDGPKVSHEDIVSIQDSELFLPPPPSFYTPRWIYSYYHGMVNFYSHSAPPLVGGAHPYLPAVQRVGMRWGTERKPWAHDEHEYRQREAYILENLHAHR